MSTVANAPPECLAVQHARNLDVVFMTCHFSRATSHPRVVLQGIRQCSSRPILPLAPGGSTVMMGSELADAVIAEIPVEYQDRFASLHRRPAPDSGELREALSAYLATVKRVSTFVVALDSKLAHHIGATCTALLDRCESVDQSKVVSTLIAYFVEEEEDEDVTGVLGLDDDLQVANAVCRAFGAHDLILERS